jgi:hypothetical protein
LYLQALSRLLSMIFLKPAGRRWSQCRNSSPRGLRCEAVKAGKAPTALRRPPAEWKAWELAATLQAERLRQDVTLAKADEASFRALANAGLAAAQGLKDDAEEAARAAVAEVTRRDATIVAREAELVELRRQLDASAAALAAKVVASAGSRRGHRPR